jgi:RNase P subunit RPR2
MTNKAISCGTNNHNFQVAEDQNERVVIFCTKCGEVRAYNKGKQLEKLSFREEVENFDSDPLYRAFIDDDIIRG